VADLGERTIAKARFQAGDFGNALLAEVDEGVEESRRS
jgi:hypothetical protein